MERRLGGGKAAHRSKRHVNLLSFEGSESRKKEKNSTQLSQTLTLKSLPLLAQSLLAAEKQMGLIIFVIMAKNAC